MKNPIILTLLLTIGIYAQQGGKPVYRVAATHESLLPIAKEAQAQNPVTKFEPATGPDSSVTVPGNLIERSDVISFNGNTTLVPKLAIIQVPKNFQSRINNHTPGNLIVTWPDFIAVNRGWITTVEVSQTQAEGKDPIAPEIVEVYSKTRNLVIATYRGGPISILPPKIEETPLQETQQETTSKEPKQ